jgi:hypothetical protein
MSDSSGQAHPRRQWLRWGGLAALAAWLQGADKAHASAGDTVIMGAVNQWLGTPTVIQSMADPVLDITADGVDQHIGLAVAGPTSAGGNHAGRAIQALGGNTSGTAVGGDGIQAFGGNAQQADGGRGVFALGGIAQGGQGGTGIWAVGGTGGNGGTGIRAEGGGVEVPGAAGGGQSGPGIEAFGGQAAFSRPGAAGVDAQGGNEARPAGLEPASGIEAFGGTDSSGKRTIGVAGRGGGQNGQAAPGVYATTTSNDQPAVHGQSAGAQPGVMGIGGVGVKGINSSPGTGGLFESNSGPGISAESTSGAGLSGQGGSEAGLDGQSTNLYGVYGQSDTLTGVAGFSDDSAGGHFSTKNLGSPALLVNNSLAANNGALGLLVVGDCIAINGPKPALVPTSRGLTRLYVAESAISVFEDFGRVTLERGRARVSLEALFAEVIETRGYRVFVTARGECRGLFVTDQDERGFTIVESQGGTSEISVNYRVVGRRKGLHPNHRLAEFKPPVSL